MGHDKGMNRCMASYGACVHVQMYFVTSSNWTTYQGTVGGNNTVYFLDYYM